MLPQYRSSVLSNHVGTTSKNSKNTWTLDEICIKYSYKRKSVYLYILVYFHDFVFYFVFCYAKKKEKIIK